MGKPTEVARPAHQTERRYRRFSLHYPVHLKVRSGDAQSEIDAVSKNVSIGGLLLEATAQIPENCSVSFVLTVQGGHVTRPIRLTGEGEVVRVEPVLSENRFAIAVKCERPIAQIEEYLSAARA